MVMEAVFAKVQQEDRDAEKAAEEAAKKKQWAQEADAALDRYRGG